MVGKAYPPPIRKFHNRVQKYIGYNKMSELQQTAKIMRQTALKLINYIRENNIYMVKNDDKFIINLLIDAQIQLLEYAFNVKPGDETDAIRSIKEKPLLRQSFINQLLDTVRFAVLVKDEEFIHITNEYLNTLVIS